MKRIIALLLVCLLLCGCGGRTLPVPAGTTAPEAENESIPETAPEATAEPTTEPTTVPTTEPEPEIFRNPLNGTILEEPFTGRIFASTISNIPEALPHIGVTDADILMEMFVNGSIIRCLALYTGIENVPAIGSVRSTRLMFNDITQHYSAILSHAGGSGQVLTDARNRGIDNFNIDQWVVAESGASYRDKEFGRYYEHCLFGVGQGIVDYAVSQGMEMTLEKDYGLVFTDEDATPAAGEDAHKVTILFTYNQAKKETIMEYDEELQAYAFHQYGKLMTDQMTNATECFENVLIMDTKITMNGMYHVADFVAGGIGYYAHGGKLMPIHWTCEGEDEAFRFFTDDGEPLELGLGHTYIAVVPNGSPVTWEPAPAPVETEPLDETTAQ